MPYSLDVSLVIPVYNEDESLPELKDWIFKVLTENKLKGELIFVDDGSTDESWDRISQFCDESALVRGIRFNRNYGKSAALNTGFRASKGEVVITLDADLQDSPDEIPDLVRMIKEDGFHLVSGWKKKRHDPIEKTIPSKLFNSVTSAFSGIKLHDFNCGLKAYHSRVVKSITVFGEQHRYIPLLAKWAGFDKIGEKVVVHRARKYGHTKYGLRRYITGFLDLLSISFVTRFAKSPMHFFGSLGTLSFGAGFIITVYVISTKLYNIYHQLPARDIVDQPLFFLALVALIVGVQLFLAGFLGEVIILNNPGRDDYIIDDEKN